jgi:hypothetical protein
MLNLCVLEPLRLCVKCLSPAMLRATFFNAKAQWHKAAKELDLFSMLRKLDAFALSIGAIAISPAAA